MDEGVGDRTGGVGVEGGMGAETVGAEDEFFVEAVAVVDGDTSCALESGLALGSRTRSSLRRNRKSRPYSWRS